MKIALTVKGAGLGAWLDDFAQCGFVMVVDDDNRFESWKNPSAAMEGQSTQILIDSILQAKPDVLVTGKISDTQKESLTTQHIKVMEDQKGFVLELLEKARAR